MKDNAFNKKLREKLEDYPSELNLSAAWEAFDAQRQPQKKDRKVLFFWMFGIAIFLLGSGVYWVSSMDDSSRWSQAGNLQPITEKAAIISTETNQKEASIIGTEQNGQTKKQIANEYTLATTIPQEKEIAQSAEVNVIEEEIAIIGTKVAPVLSQAVNEEQSATNLADITSSQILNYPQIVSGDIPFRTSENTNLKTNENKVIVPERFTEKSTIAPITSVSLHPFLISLNEPIINQLPSPVNNRRRRLTSAFGFQLNYGKSFKNLTAGSSVSEMLIQNWQRAETNLDAFGLSLFYRKGLGERLFLQTELGVIQRTDLLEAQYQEVTTEMFDNQVVEIIQLSAGEEQFVYGSIEGVVTDNITAKTYTKTQLLQLPILLGYKLLDKQYVDFSILGGFSYALWMKKRGRTYHEFEERNFSELSHKQNGLWQGQIRLEAAFKLQNDWTVIAGLNGTFDINNVFESQVDWKEKYQFLGMQLGAFRAF